MLRVEMTHARVRAYKRWSFALQSGLNGGCDKILSEMIQFMATFHIEHCAMAERVGVDLHTVGCMATEYDAIQRQQ